MENLYSHQYNHCIIGEKISEGAHGTIHHCLNNPDIVVKILRDEYLFYNEKNMYERIINKNINGVYTPFIHNIDHKQKSIVMEKLKPCSYMPEINRELNKLDKKFMNDVKISYMPDHYLWYEDKHILDNYMVDKNGKYKIIDFSLQSKSSFVDN